MERGLFSSVGADGGYWEGMLRFWLEKLLASEGFVHDHCFRVQVSGDPDAAD